MGVNSQEVQANVAFKNLLGKGLTDLTKGIGNEAEGNFLSVPSNKVTTQAINISPAQAVIDGVAQLIAAELHPDPTSNGHAFMTTLAATISSGATLTIGKKYYVITTAVHETVTFAVGDSFIASSINLASGTVKERVLGLIDPKFGLGYEAKPKIAAAAIPVDDPKLWIYQYDSGIFFQEVVTGGTPDFVDVHQYVGTTLFDSPSSLTVTELDAAPSIANVVEIRFSNDSVTDLGSGIIEVNNGISGLTFAEVDASPAVSAVTSVTVPNGTLVDDGGGAISLTFGLNTFDIAGDTGIDQTVGDASVLSVLGGVGIETVASVTSTISVNLSDTTVVAGTYGSAINSPQLVVDAQGRLTLASDVAIDHNLLLNYSINEHRQINDAGSTSTELFSSSKILSLFGAATNNADVKDSVITVGTSNQALTGVGQLIQGHTVVSGDRIGLVGQSDPIENGIYVAAAGAWSRSTDADEDDEVTNGLTFFVSRGNKAGNQYILTNTDPVVVGSDALSFTEVLRIELGTSAGQASEGNDSRFQAWLFTGSETNTDPIYHNAQVIIGDTSAADTAYLQVAESTTARSSIRMLEGVAPTSPTNGDMWITTTDIVARINGVSKSLLQDGLYTASGTVPTTVVATVTDTLKFATGKVIFDSLQYTDGNQGAGKVMTSDASGNVTWSDASGDGDGIYDASGSLTLSTTVTQASFNYIHSTTGDANAFVILGASGFVGVNIAAPLVPLHVSGNARFDTTGVNGFEVISTSSSAGILWKMSSVSAPTGTLSGLELRLTGANTINQSLNLYATGASSSNRALNIERGIIHAPHEETRIYLDGAEVADFAKINVRFNDAGNTEGGYLAVFNGVDKTISYGYKSSATSGQIKAGNQGYGYWADLNIADGTATGVRSFVGKSPGAGTEPWFAIHAIAKVNSGTVVSTGMHAAFLETQVSTSDTLSGNAFGAFITSSGGASGGVTGTSYGIKIENSWAGTATIGNLIGIDVDVSTSATVSGNHFAALFKGGAVGIGVTGFGTSAINVLGIGIGGEPSTSPADMIQMYAKDSSIGSDNATLAFRTEQAVEAIGTFTPSHKLLVWINGTEYRVQLDAV